MELQREQPPAYRSHDPEDLKLPSVPQNEPFQSHAHSDITLPDLQTALSRPLPPKTVHPNKLLDETFQNNKAVESQQLGQQYTSTAPPRIDASPRMNVGARPSLEAVVSPSDTGSVMSIDEPLRRSASIVSIEDPDVRLAAEALSGLGNPDFARSPANAQSFPASQTSSDGQVNVANSRQGDAEPLLTLFADAHPWVGGTINGSLSAYTTTKYYSPRIVQYGANLIERNIGSPVASAVSSVGRRTGVESGIRRYLGSRRPSDFERTDSSEPNNGSWHKRRRVDGEMDVEHGAATPAIAETSPRPDGHEYLPAYRASKPPSYREEMSPQGMDRTHMQERPAHNRSWSTKLLVSTSGLGVALSESSLQSLKYCVGLLTKATEHVETVMDALKLVLQEYDRAQERRRSQHDARREKEIEAGVAIEDGGMQAEQDEAARRLAERIKQLCDDIWQTMKTVTNHVSTYAGGALPENARNIVKGQLMSIPQRWRFVSDAVAAQDRRDGGESGISGEEGQTRRSAHRMIAFAKEGLDMMANVNGVVKITLESAEGWLDSLGRSNRASKDQEMMDADDPRSSEEKERQ